MRFEVPGAGQRGRHKHSPNTYCEHNGDLPDRPRLYCVGTTTCFVGSTAPPPPVPLLWEGDNG